MSVVLNPYLSFKGTAREAMEFYHSVLGGELRLMTFGDLNAAQDESETDLIMHGQIDGDHGVTLMGSDVPNRMPFEPGAGGFGVSLSGDDEATLTGWYEQLSVDGTISMPLQKAIWGDIFAMFTDRYGTNWIVNISGEA